MLHAPVNGSFMAPQIPDGGLMLAPQVTFSERFASPNIARIDQLGEVADIEAILRGDFSGDANQAIAQLLKATVDMTRGITSGMTAFPVRENLEAEAKVLVPRMTPLRNRLARSVGSGKASAWKQLTSLGGGYGAKGTTASSGSAAGGASVVLTANAEPLGFRVGDEITVGTEGPFIITAISTTTITINANLAANQYSKAVTKVNITDGSVGTLQVFFAEDGAPAEATSVYADASATYRLLGTIGKITGFAMASGANFQPQYETERGNSLLNLMLLEEFALTNGIASDVNKPWGDGTTAYGYNGLIASVPSGNTTASSGALTLAQIASTLASQWRAGAVDPWIMLSASEMVSINNLTTPTTTVLRVINPSAEQMKTGMHVSHVVHPIDGTLVPLLVSPFCPKGTMVFGCDKLPDMSPAHDVDVLPQVALPDGGLYTNGIQGYTVQEIANTISAPQVYPWLTSVYEVYRMKATTVFFKRTGVLPNA
jgi:hypothetical protein